MAEEEMNLDVPLQPVIQPANVSFGPTADNRPVQIDAPINGGGDISVNPTTHIGTVINNDFASPTVIEGQENVNEEENVEIEMPKEKKKRKRCPPVPRCVPNKGWFGYGCLVIVILSLAATICVLLQSKANDQDQITDTNSVKDQTTETSEDKVNLVVTAGYDQSKGNLATSELISSEGVCSKSIPTLPVALNAHQSTYFDNALMVCGGRNDQQKAQKTCYQLHSSNSKWIQGPTMNEERFYFSMTKAGQDLYSLGGTGLDSMEKLSGSSGEWEVMEQKLTSARENYCTVFIEMTRSLVVTGGLNTNKVEEFSLTTSTWKQLTPLPLDLSLHACIVWEETILITGGSNLGYIQMNVYQLIRSSWKTIGELQLVRYGHTMANLDNKVLVIGGNTKQDSIEEMQEDFTFQLMQWKLSTNRGNFAVTQIPNEMFPCS